MKYNLDRYISVYSRTSTAGAAGGAVEAYALRVRLPAEKIEVSAREFRTASAAHSQTEAMFRIRYRSDVTPTDRIGYNGKTYDVISATEEGREEWTLIAAQYTEGRA